ncbi:MAG: hypothetical protein WCK21_01270 [Actinomycetota bacterium]
MKIGRLIGGCLLGFLFFLFVAIDLVLFGVIPLNSIMVTLLPLIGVLLMALLGILAARGHRAPAAQPATPGAMPPPPPA